ncbi:MAG: bifunctional oligoribonuclease/PAP phosphatase NrnA [Spirosomataceae bacterium]
MQRLDELKALLSSPKRVVITTHHKPDADALGSSLGLAGYLQKKNHIVKVITPSDYPKFLNWMSGNEDVIEYSDKTKATIEELIQEAELIFCLDFNALSRIHEMGDMVKNAPAAKVMIDHHLKPEDFADFVYSEPSAAATAQLIFNFIELCGDADLMDVAMGECLYAGILTDTGAFKYPSTTPEVHYIAAALMRLGVNTNRVHRLIYDNTSVERLRFLGYVLSKKLVVLPEYRVAYIAVTKEELKRFSSQTGDTEGVVNYALSIEGMVMAALLVDRSDMIKISFRSVDEFSVSDFARNHFDGGGHKNASGGKSYLSLDETVQKFVSLLPFYKDELLSVL